MQNPRKIWTFSLFCGMLWSVIRMNVFRDNFFDFRLQGDLNLHYCGNRERSIDHRYIHRQAAYLLTYVVEGQATLTLGDRRLTLGEGDVYVMFPESGASYVTASGQPWSIRWVTLTGTQLETLLPLLGFTPESPVLHAAQPARIEHVLEELFRKTIKADNGSKLGSMALLYELLACLAKQAEAPVGSPTIADSVHYISRHYAEEITVSELADRAFLNSNYFSKLFTSQVGITPQQFVTRTRMEKAKELLTYSELTVAEIAATVGFADALYFSRAFKRYTGESPSAFRAADKF